LARNDESQKHKQEREMKEKAIRIGTDVRWSSQAGGVWKTKRGEVVGHVKSKEIPNRDKFKGLNASASRGRDHLSYVVKAKSGRHYWPRVSSLKRD
jgi:hypothetical protein